MAILFLSKNAKVSLKVPLVSPGKPSSLKQPTAMFTFWQSAMAFLITSILIFFWH